MMPVKLFSVSDEGAYLGLLYAPDVYRYKETNKTTASGALKSLKSISPDDNPVVVFME